MEEKSRTTDTFYELTELGKQYVKNGTPLMRVFRLVKEQGALSLPQIASTLGLDNKDVGTAFGQLSKDGCIMIEF